MTEPVPAAESVAIEVRRRSLPDRLRYHAERIYKAAGDYAISEIQYHAIALKTLAEELEGGEQSDGHIDGDD